MPMQHNSIEKFEDTKVVAMTSSRISKKNTDNTMTKRIGAKGQTMIYATFHRLYICVSIAAGINIIS
jgi:hypothetical protein